MNFPFVSRKKHASIVNELTEDNRNLYDRWLIEVGHRYGTGKAAARALHMYEAAEAERRAHILTIRRLKRQLAKVTGVLLKMHTLDKGQDVDYMPSREVLFRDFGHSPNSGDRKKRKALLFKDFGTQLETPAVAKGPLYKQPSKCMRCPKALSGVVCGPAGMEGPGGCREFCGPTEKSDTCCKLRGQFPAVINDAVVAYGLNECKKATD